MGFVAHHLRHGFILSKARTNHRLLLPANTIPGKNKPRSIQLPSTDLNSPAGAEQPPSPAGTGMSVDAGRLVGVIRGAVGVATTDAGLAGGGTATTGEPGVDAGVRVAVDLRVGVGTEVAVGAGTGVGVAVAVGEGVAI